MVTTIKIVKREISVKAVAVFCAHICWHVLEGKNKDVSQRKRKTKMGTRTRNSHMPPIRAMAEAGRH
jgi:hypothetical protein